MTEAKRQIFSLRILLGTGEVYFVGPYTLDTAENLAFEIGRAGYLHYASNDKRYIDYFPPHRIDRISISPDFLRS